MGRISHHLKRKDYKKTHQRKLDEQRALYLVEREREIREQQYLKEIETLSQPYKSNWRSDLFEGMTTSGLLYTTLQATGETDLDSVDAPTEFTGDVISGHNFTIGRRADISVDYSKYDTVVVDITTGGGASSWSDNTGGTFVPNVYAFFYTTDSSGSLIQNGDGLGGQPRKVPPFGTLSTIDTLLSSGTNIIPIPSNYRVGDLKLLVYQVANTNSSISGGVTPNTTFNSITLRRRSPLNVILGLDDPEATNFVRTDPTQKGLSAEERRKRLEGMLDAGDELLLKLGVQGSKARPADTGNVQGWEQAATYPQDPKWIRDLEKEYQQNKNKPNNPGTPKPGRGLGDTWEGPIRQAQSNQDTQIAQVTDDPSTWPSRFDKLAPAVIDPKTGFPSMPGTLPGQVLPGQRQPGGIKLKLAKNKNKQTMVAHYELQGQVISEKKLK